MSKSRFKFRAWDKKEKYMYHIEYDVADYHQGFYIEDAGGLNEDDLIWSQCTGLKDKNGKDIYEGDILNFSDHHDQEYYNSPNNLDGLLRGRLVTVSWKYSRWFLNDINFKRSSYHEFCPYDSEKGIIPEIEVIGTSTRTQNY